VRGFFFCRRKEKGEVDGQGEKGRFHFRRYRLLLEGGREGEWREGKKRKILYSPLQGGKEGGEDTEDLTFSQLFIRERRTKKRGDRDVCPIPPREEGG